MFRMNLAGALLGAVLLALPASADVSIQDLLLRKEGKDINVRVVIGNPGASAQKGPVKVTLFVRPHPNSEWKSVKVWTDISAVKPGDKVSRDLFAANSELLRNAAANPEWEAKATAEAPGAKSAEKSVVNKGDTEKGK